MPHSSLWTYICFCSSKASRACLPACWKLGDLNPIRELGWDWPRSSPPPSPLAEEGLGKLGLGQILPPLPRAAVLTPLETQFHLSTVKIDAGDQPQIPLLSFLGFFQRKTVLLRVPLKDETQSFQVISKSDNVTMCCR